MKRGLVLSLCAAAVAAMTAPAFANVDASLNLRYTDPADPSAGGTWQLVVQAPGTNGLAGIDAQVDGASGVTGIDTGSINSTNAAFDNVDSVFRFRPEGAGAEVVAGDDLDGTEITGVGTGSGAGNIANDALLNPAWNNSALIASGSFGATRPSLTIEGANEFDGTPAALQVASGDITSVTRGDSETSLGLEGAGLGLLPGDANRDGSVNGSDFALLGGSWQQAADWDGGDFTGADNFVDGSDFALLGGNWQQSQVPVAISAVPEPTSVVLFSLSFAGLLATRRRM